MDVKLIFVLLAVNLLKASGQCTFQSPFASSTWHDNTRGTVVFGTTTMTGWSVTVLFQTVSAWQCVDSSDSLTMVIRSQSTITYSSTQIYVYLCMTLTKITDHSYYYYQRHNPEVNAGQERLWFSQSDSLTMSEVCNLAAVIPTLEFHVLVESGNEAAAAVTCADTLLYNTDYSYSDGTNTACESTTDYWDVCTSTSQMTFNYTTCSQEIAYSAGGQLHCVANMGQCSVVYNQDTSIVSTTRQFSCICSNGQTASVAPKNCTSDQSSSALPTAADGTTVVGHLLTYGTKHGPESSAGVSVGLIVGIVVALILVGVAAAIAVYCYLRHRKNKVSESEKPMLTNGAVAHSETIDETSRGVKREKTAISAISREKTDLDRSLIQRHATMTSIGLSMKKEKSTVSKVDVETGDKQEDKKSLGTTIAGFLPCLKKKQEPEEEKAKVEEPAIEKKPQPKPKAPAKGGAAGKGGKKGAAKGKGKAGKGKKTKGAQTDKAEEMTVADVDEADTVQTPKKEKTDLLGNQPPQMTSTPIPKPEQSQQSPKMSKKKGGKQTQAAVKNGTVSAKTPAVVNGLTKEEANPESKEWTFLACCFGNRSPPPQDTEDAAGPIEKNEVAKGKVAAKTTTKTGAKKPVVKKGGKKGGGKKADGKGKKEDGGKDEEKAGVEENKLERAKTMPERQREKTMLSITDAEKVKVDVYVPDENTPMKLKDTVTVMKGKNGDAPTMEKAKSSLGFTRPASSTSRASLKKKDTQSGQATKKGKKKAKSGGKGGGEKKAAKKKKK